MGMMADDLCDMAAKGSVGLEATSGNN